MKERGKIVYQFLNLLWERLFNLVYGSFYKPLDCLEFQHHWVFKTKAFLVIINRWRDLIEFVITIAQIEIQIKADFLSVCTTDS